MFFVRFLCGVVLTLRDRTEKEVSNISEITSTIEALSSIPVLEIDANRNIRPIYAALKEKLKPYLDYVSLASHQSTLLVCVNNAIGD